METTCCIVGGGPAGIMLGLLLARSGVDVVVLEKHSDFNRDFRGDTIHPSTLDLLAQLGMLDEFLRLPHQEMSTVNVTISGRQYRLADFSHLPTRCKFIAFMPQWDFLNFISRQALQYPGFHLRMQTECIDLIENDGVVTGVRARTPSGELEIRADLVIGADGRHSRVRARAALVSEQFGVPIDILWLRLPKDPRLAPQSLGYFTDGRFMVLIDRADYFQCGFLIAKGSYASVQDRGLAAFRAAIVSLAPFTADGVEQVKSWDQVSLLTVLIDRLDQWWKPGLLCIGDAAHAMSPAGGVGINLAIQDAVAAANILATALRERRVTPADLAAVQPRRLPPARQIQRMQAFIHAHFINARADARSSLLVRAAFAVLKIFPILGRIPARFVGVGPRPETIEAGPWKRADGDE